MSTPKKPAVQLQQNISKITAIFNKKSLTQQLLLGSVSGWISGCLSLRLGKTATFAAGCGILAFQAARQTNYIRTDWSTVLKKAQETSKKMNSSLTPLSTNAKKFAESNTAFTAGFIGGFLIGLAT